MDNDQTATNEKTNQVAIIGFVGAFFMPLVGFILSIIALNQISKTKEKGKGFAIAGLVISSLAMIFAVFIITIVFMAIPTLQRIVKDNATKNDAITLFLDIEGYKNAHNGVLAPSVYAMTESKLSTVETILNQGVPSATSAVYTQGQNCDGTQDPTSYSVKVALKNGKTYCIDTYSSATR